MFNKRAGGIMANAGGTSLVGGVGGILPQTIFKYGGSETLFSALVLRCPRKIDLKINMKMANNYCKTLQSKYLSLKKTSPSRDLMCLA